MGNQRSNAFADGGDRASFGEAVRAETLEARMPSPVGRFDPFAVLALISFFLFVLSDVGVLPTPLASLQRLWSTCLLLLALVSLKTRSRLAHSGEERRFWNRLILALGFWLLSDICFALVPAREMPLGVSLLIDACYGLYYYALILAINRLPHQRDPKGLDGLIDRLLYWPANAVFILGFFTYFVLIPAVWNRQLYDSFAPYTYAYILLDSYIVVSLLHRARTVDSVRWRALYRLISGTFVLSLVAGMVAVLTYGLHWDLAVRPRHFYRLMLLSLVVCLAWWGRRYPPSREASGEVAVEEVPKLHWYTLFSALLLPWIHLLFYTLGWLDMPSKAPREVMLLIWTFLIGGVAVLQHRVLDRTRQRLQAGHQVLSEELAGEKKAHSEKERLISELEAKNSEMERFTYTISHDLKSPLVTIQGFVGMLEQDLARGDEVRMAKDLQRIRNAATTMQDLLEDLLELSRIGRVVNTPQRVRLSDLIDEVLESAAGPLEGIRVRVDLPRDAPVLWGDRPRLFEVFLNLVENAARHRGEGDDSWIQIGLVDAPAHPPVVPGRLPEEVDDDVEGVTVYVRDNGAGIDAAYHEKVFGLFERLDPSIEGTGIGLALVRRIVEHHGGRTWVESEGRGFGSTFFVYLPLLIEPDGDGSV